LRCLGVAVHDKPPALAKVQQDAVDSNNFIKIEVGWAIAAAALPFGQALGCRVPTPLPLPFCSKI
jgi:hypothetical protein